MEHSSSDKLPFRKEIRLFRNKIIRWFNRNKRYYPWRDTNDPFKVLIAEMMLRRTKANHYLKMLVISVLEVLNISLSGVLHQNLHIKLNG